MNQFQRMALGVLVAALLASVAVAQGAAIRSYAGATDGRVLPSSVSPTTSIGDTDGSPSSEQPLARRSP